MDISMLNLDDVPEINLDLVAMKAEICRVQTECCRRGLNQTSKWLAEINFAMNMTRNFQSAHNWKRLSLCC